MFFDVIVVGKWYIVKDQHAVAYKRLIENLGNLDSVVVTKQA
jgi:hypothetical protein